ncbi:hypothetical protein [Coleofasciculus sp. A1-SPW-01]|uniref:hypothetical protein n=1 Tax=Coleofasciculus sp. A1-SPW-01 TaxID=3070819 RepID=UPI004062C759
MTALGIPLNPYQGLKPPDPLGSRAVQPRNSPESLSGIETDQLDKTESNTDYSEFP